MQADILTAEHPAGTLILADTSSFNGEVMRLWMVRTLTVLLILAGVVMTFYILGTLGFAVYGLPRASFRRRATLARAA